MNSHLYWVGGGGGGGGILVPSTLETNFDGVCGKRLSVHAYYSSLRIYLS